MAVRPVLKMGDPRLWQIAQPVTAFATPELYALIADMEETMQQMEGVGLAAPQIGVDWRVVIFGFSDDAQDSDVSEDERVPYTILINPSLTPLSKEQEDGWEGCLSVPGLRGEVRRWAKLRYSGFDPQGQVIEREVSGFHARVVQHECDHLDGVLYPARIKDFTRFGFTDEIFPEDDASS